MVRVHPSGSATVYTGTSPNGQGLDTSFAQIAADRLGIDPENVDVLHGDTDQGPDAAPPRLELCAHWRIEIVSSSKLGRIDQASKLQERAAGQATGSR